MNILLFIFKDSFYFEGEKKREREFLSTGSFLIMLQPTGLGQVVARNQELHPDLLHQGLLHTQQRSKHLCHLPQAISKELDHKQSSWDTNGGPYRRKYFHTTQLIGDSYPAFKKSFWNSTTGKLTTVKKMGDGIEQAFFIAQMVNRHIRNKNVLAPLLSGKWK